MADTEQAVVEAARAVLAAQGVTVGGGVGDRERGAPELGGRGGVGRGGGGAVVSSPLWAALQRNGLLGLAAPVDLGGEGLGVPEVMALLTELARAGAVGPASATLALGVLPCARWGTPEQQRLLIAPVLDAGALLTAAWREPSGAITSTARPALPRTTATTATGGPVRAAPGGTDLVATGVQIAVPYAEQAHRILVPVTLASGNPALAVVAPTAPGVRLERTPTSAGTPEYTLHLAGAPVETLLGATATGGLGWQDRGGGIVADLYRLVLTAACAVADGLVQGALDLTATHVTARHQFGRPLAAFQAVAQQVADVYLAARTLQLVTRAAVHRLASRPGDTGSAGPDVDRDLAIAAYWVARYGPPALRTCHHLHGGLGLDLSYPLHEYSSALKDLVRITGGSEQCLQRLALLDEPSLLTGEPVPPPAGDVPGPHVPLGTGGGAAVGPGGAAVGRSG